MAYTVLFTTSNVPDSLGVAFVQPVARVAEKNDMVSRVKGFGCDGDSGVQNSAVNIRTATHGVVDETGALAFVSTRLSRFGNHLHRSSR